LKGRISITMKWDIWYSPPNTTWKTEYAVAMDASTAPTTMSTFRQHDWRKSGPPSRQVKKRMPRKKKTTSEGKGSQVMPLAKAAPSDFFEDVFDVVRQVPAGRVTTYGAIAAYLGSRRSARMVGWAMNASHHASPAVPAQRVVNRQGLLSGKHHFPFDKPMEVQLRAEGVEVREDQVVDFARHFWDPTIALGL